MWRTLVDQNETDWNLSLELPRCRETLPGYHAGGFARRAGSRLRGSDCGVAAMGIFFLKGNSWNCRGLPPPSSAGMRLPAMPTPFALFALIEGDKPDSKEERGEQLQLAIADFFKSEEHHHDDGVGRGLPPVPHPHAQPHDRKDGDCGGGRKGCPRLQRSALHGRACDSREGSSESRDNAWQSDRQFGLHHPDVWFCRNRLDASLPQRDPAAAAEALAKAGNRNADVVRLFKSIQGSSQPAPAAARVQPPVKKSGCFIATAACGSPFAAEVESLRAYRDSVLRPSRLGRLFVRCYERTSPPVALSIEGRPKARRLVRGLLIRPLAALAEAGLRRTKLRKH